MGQIVKRYVVISDLQLPYEHKRAVAALLDYVKKTKPDGLVCVGDEADLPMVSRWESGGRGEYSLQLQKQLDYTKDLLTKFRVALGDNKPFWVARSNHTDRLEKYIELKAPALKSLNLSYDKLVGMPELGITYNKTLTKIAPNTIMGHGDEYKISQVAGMTALKLMEQTGQNVVIGHTHRQGIVYRSEGHSGHVSARWGMEAGHLMDIRQAGYLRPLGAANWQLGFAELLIEGNLVVPQLIPMANDGSFVALGKVWGK